MMFGMGYYLLEKDVSSGVIILFIFSTFLLIYVIIKKEKKEKIPPRIREMLDYFEKNDKS